MARPLFILLDVIAVLIFAAIGRASHAEALDLNGLSRTAMPFLAGALMAWILLTMRPYLAPTLWRQGLFVWVATLVLGMLFRSLLGDGIQVAFVIVAGLALAALQFGWRGIAALVTRGRGTASNR